MKLSKFTVILAVLLISIMAIGAVSAESVDDFGAITVNDEVGDVQESVDVTDDAGDLGTADNADLTVEDESGAVLGDEPDSYDIDDDNYASYFNEDGTAKDALSADGGYTLNVGTLNNKDIKITSGSQINIIGKEGAGFINNGTIYIGGGTEGNANTITISGLTFTNTNKGAIDIAQKSADITIKENIMNLVGDASLDPGNSYLTVTAISPHDYINGLNVIDNKVTVTGDAPYSNGIWAMNWGSISAPSNFNIIGNTFDINSSATAGAAEAVYVECSDSVIENNNITVKTIGSTFAYGIQVPDTSFSMMNYGEDPTSNSPKNVTIKNNNVNLETQYMAYGITLISFAYDVEEECNFAFPLNFVITENNLYIKSDKGVFGIGGIFYDDEISNNNLTIIGGSSEGIYSEDMLRVGTVAINVTTRASYVDEEEYGFEPELKVFNNNIYTNVTAEWTNDDDYVTFDNHVYQIQNDFGQFLIDSATFDAFFDENGNLKGVIPEGSTVLLGTLTNKKMNINIPLTILAWDEDDELRNTVINLVEGADGTVIDGLNFKFTGDETTGSIGLIYAKAVENIIIKNNVIKVDNFVDKTGAKYGSSIYAIELESGATGCNHVLITGNNIDITGSARYLYGIDVFKTYGGENKNTDVNITFNTVTVRGGSRMAEPIYVSDSIGVLIANNTCYSDSSASAYGIATDSLENAIISDNRISADSDAMAYAITSTNSNGITMERNNIFAEGAGAVGIGLMNDDTVSINGNTIEIYGGDYITTTTGDTLGTANAAILDKSGNENINIGQNDITENLPLFINNDNYDTYFNADGTIKDDSGIEDNAYIVFDKLTGKTIVLTRPLKIEGTTVDTQIIITTGAEGTLIYSLDMEATVDSGSYALIHVKEVNNVQIVRNNLVITCNNDLSTWDMIMPIEIDGGALGCNNILVTENNITVTGAAPYVYGIDVFKDYYSEAYVTNVDIQNNNIVIDVNSVMSEAIYLSGVKESTISGNIIKSISSNSAYGIGADSLYNVMIRANDITVNAEGMAYGITSTIAGKEVIIISNKLDVTGTGAMGIGISGQDGTDIYNNIISIEGGDYTTLQPSDVLGVGNAAIFVGDGNTNTNMDGNALEEFTSIKLEFADLTVTAAPSGEGSFEVTVKTVDGQVLANKEITFTFNNQVIKATTDANGVAKLSFALNKAGKYSVNIAFLGDKHYKGALETATITINPIKTSLTASGKTFLATATTKKLTATLKDANGKAIAKKKVTFTVNGKTYTATTNANGVATVKLALKAAKTYTVSIKFAGDDVYAASTKSVKVKLNKEKTKLTAPKKTFKRTAKTKKVVITLKNSKGKAIAKKKVTLTVNKKKYTVKTNKKGKATFKVKLTKKGTFKYTAKFAGDSQYKAVKKTAKITIK